MLLKKGHGLSNDTWNLGMLTYELLSGEIPFSSLPENEKIHLF